MTTLTPQRWLTYKGNHVGSVGQIMGPNLLGEWFTVTAARYDEPTNTTRLGLAYGRHDLAKQATS